MGQFVKMIFYYLLKLLKTTLKFIKRVTFYIFLCVCLIFIFYCVLIWWLDERQKITYNNKEKHKSSTNSTSRLTQLVEEWKHPVIVWWNTHIRDTSEIVLSKDIKCILYGPGHRLKKNIGGAYLFYASLMDFRNLPLPRQPHNILWAFVHEESPRNIDELQNAEILALFNISATFSRYSHVPFPLQAMGYFTDTLDDITSTKYYVETSNKNTLLKELAPILYIQSNCETTTERDNYVKELMKYIKVDSYGKCLQNKGSLPFDTEKDYLNNFKSNEYLKFISRYKFHVAIENAVCSDYVTEKFWRPIIVGSVPIYFGSPLIKDWFPNKKSAILLEDFPSPKILSEHIKELLSNDTLYEEYLEHKTKGILTNDRLLTELKLRPYQTRITNIWAELERFVCKKLHEIKNKSKVQSLVTKTHYDCPKPVSALFLKVNPENIWVKMWKQSKITAKYVYHAIKSNSTSLNSTAYDFLKIIHI